MWPMRRVLVSRGRIRLIFVFSPLQGDNNSNDTTIEDQGTNAGEDSQKNKGEAGGVMLHLRAGKPEKPERANEEGKGDQG